MASLRDSVANFLGRERPALFHFPAQCLEFGNRFPYLAQRGTALRNQARDRFVVPGNHDFLAARHAIEEISESGFCVKRADGSHAGSKSTSHQLFECVSRTKQERPGARLPLARYL